MTELKENLQFILEEKNSKIIPENIRSGITIFNVAGTLEEKTLSKEEYNRCKDLTNNILNQSGEIKPYLNKLSYIEASGNQYIDTLIVPDNNILVEFKYIKNSGIIDTEPLFSAGNVFQLNRNASTNQFFATVNNSYDSYTINLYNDTEYVIKMGNGVVNVNGESLITNFPLPNESSNNIEIFRTVDYGIRTGAFKLYYFNIWRNGLLIRNLIPVEDKLNVPCLYDNISNELFYNKGTGIFGKGEIIN